MDDLNEAERKFHALIAEQVAARAAAAREEQELTRNIAALCIEARHEGVIMARLAEWVKVVDPKTGALRSVTRQAVDQLVAAHEGRERAPRRKKPKAETNGAGAINMEAFGG